jgi:hypothetical protein
VDIEEGVEREGSDELELVREGSFEWEEEAGE